MARELAVDDAHGARERPQVRFWHDEFSSLAACLYLQVTVENQRETSAVPRDSPQPPLVLPKLKEPTPDRKRRLRVPCRDTSALTRCSSLPLYQRLPRGAEVTPPMEFSGALKSLVKATSFVEHSHDTPSFSGSLQTGAGGQIEE